MEGREEQREGGNKKDGEEGKKSTEDGSGTQREMARVHFPVEECSHLVTTRIDISGRGMQKSKSGIRMEFRFKAKKWDSCFGSIVSPIVSI